MNNKIKNHIHNITSPSTNNEIAQSKTKRKYLHSRFVQPVHHTNEDLLEIYTAKYYNFHVMRV